MYVEQSESNRPVAEIGNPVLRPIFDRSVLGIKLAPGGCREDTMSISAFIMEAA